MHRDHPAVNVNDLLARHADYAFRISYLESIEILRVLRRDSRAMENGLAAGKQGPGGGAEATSFVAGFLTVGLSLSGPRPSLVRRVWEYWNLPHVDSMRSVWAGA